MNHKRRKIIVTGGCGYIGSHTAIELIQNDYEVVLMDDLSNSSIKTLDRIESITGINPNFVKIDLKKEQATDKIFELHKDAQGVIHFAAHKAVGESTKQPLRYYENNIKSLIHVLKAIEKYKMRNFIFSSSATVYGYPEQLPINEESSTRRPFSPYGNTKKVGEEILEDTVQCGWLKAISLRYFNPIGAHESGNLGELPNGTPNNLMPFITQTAIGKLEQLQVFGDDYSTIDGTAVRDYIHVVDLAKAHVKAMDYLISKDVPSIYEIFNLGTGLGYSVMEIIKHFEKISASKLNYVITKRRKGDVPELYANADKAFEKLKWKTEKNLESMIKDSWRWEQNIMKGE